MMTAFGFARSRAAVMAAAIGIPLLGKADIGKLSDTERTALAAALAASDLASVRQMFDKHRLDPRDALDGKRIYWHAAAAENPGDESRLEVLKYLLGKGGPIDGPLTIEWFCNSLVPESTPEFVTMLASKSLRNSRRTDLGDTPLSRAAATGNPEVVKMVIEKFGVSGAQARPRVTLKRIPSDGDGAKDAHYFEVYAPPSIVAAVWGGNASRYASSKGSHHVEGPGNKEQLKRLNAFWEAQAKPIPRDGDEDREEDIIKVLEILDEKFRKSYWNGPDAFGMTALHYAACRHMPKVVEFLLEKGADTRRRDSWGRTPVHLAALVESPRGKEVLTALSRDEEGAGISPFDDEGNTPLALAAKKGKSGPVSILLELGADPFIVNEQFESIVSKAASGSDTERVIAEALRIADAKSAIRYEATIQKQLVSMPALLYTDSARAAVGSASDTIITLRPRPKPYDVGPMNVRFNRPVGASMQGSLPKITEYLRQRVGGWPSGMEAEIRFENRYGNKDGDSASVVCGILLYSAMSSYRIDPAFCCTGSMDKDGKVKPIGGLTQKLRAANKEGYGIMGIPIGNADDLRDHVLLHGLGDLVGPQVFSLSTFDEALAVAALEKPQTTAVALATFAPVIKAMGGGKLSLVKHSAVQQKLRETLKLAPNHLTARIFLESALGRLPEHLSLSGCYEALNDAWRPLSVALSSGSLDNIGAIDENLFATSQSLITRLRPKLDPRARPLADAQADYAELLKKISAAPPISPAGIRNAVSEIRRKGGEIDEAFERFAEEYDLETRRRELEEEDRESNRRGNIVPAGRG